MEYYKINNRNNKKLLEVRIKGIDNITTISHELERSLFDSKKGELFIF